MDDRSVADYVRPMIETQNRTNPKPTRLIRVAAAVIRRGPTLLIAKRRPGGKHGGLWEFPGGKIESGESPEVCLRRELIEELGANSDIGAFVGRSLCEQGDVGLELLAYEARLTSDIRELRAHDAVKWILPAQLLSFPMPPADLPIVALLLTAKET